jgi:hypothetical protein
MTKSRTSTGPLCAECLINRVTKHDSAAGCTRCTECRQHGPAPNPEPEPTGSWWIGLSRGAFTGQVAQELDRMRGSREARSLGYRFSVDELGRKARGVGES